MRSDGGGQLSGAPGLTRPKPPTNSIERGPLVRLDDALRETRCQLERGGRTRDVGLARDAGGRDQPKVLQFAREPNVAPDRFIAAGTV